MPRINILDKSVFNLIAAGEVVEKPSSVVKELVENSIDAGATSITIEIVNGGIKKIRVSDNGCGIHPDDLAVAFNAHTTSKIKDKEDLDSIGTLGFRGEALSSIAIVSKVSLTSKIKDLEIGKKIVIHGGEIKSEEPVGSTDGTTLIVEDIFFNVPARAKFLRKPKQEEGDITNLISRLILANPSISIKYIADNKMVYQSTGEGLFEAIYTIYGKSVINNLAEVNFKNDKYKFSGFIGKPNFSKPNRTYQTLIINGRYVVNQTISFAVHKAFENFMMKGSFPFYVLNLELPLDSVDVNVHPNKLDVKFENSNGIFTLVLNEISKKLYDVDNIEKISLLNSEQKASKPTINLSHLTVVSENTGINFEEKQTIQNLSTSEKILEVIVDSKEEENTPQNSNYNSNMQSATSFLSEKIDVDRMDGVFTIRSDDGFLHNLVNNYTEKQKQMENLSQKENQTLFAKDDFPYKIVGTVFNTYIIIEKKSSIFFIDQHAGHERILYDKFKEEYNKKNIVIQPMIIPFILDVNSIEYEYISANLDSIQKMGFDIEVFGNNCFKISSVPLLLKNININIFFNEILKNINQNNLTIKNTDILEDYIAKTACRSAVKANDIISKEEIQMLLKILEETQVLLCPHGRPIVLEVSIKEIEKWFKRMV